MNFDNPSYLENDYLDNATPIAGIHPEPISDFRQSEINARKNDPFHYQVQYAPPPTDDQPLAYTYRSNIAPYSTHYEFGNKPSAMAWGAVDPSTAGVMSPFRSAVATGGIILLGAVVGEMLAGTSTLQGFFNKKTSAFYKKRGLPKGYGAIIGAVVANALRLSIANGLYQGGGAAAKALGGGLLPVLIPIGLTYGKVKIKDDIGKLALIIGGFGFLSFPIILQKMNK